MLRSLYSGISGLRSHQTMLDVTGNNIANVNTSGYKATAVQFQDTLSQLTQGATAPGANNGGSNPAQVGLGVLVSGITTNFTQGSAQSTGRATDLMISGDGYFVTKQGDQTTYTRAGAFDVDASGRLVTTDGKIVQGWTGVDGVINTGGAVGNVTLPEGAISPAKATGNVTMGGNLPSETTAGDAAATPPVPAGTIVRDMTVYNNNGVASVIPLTFTRTAGGWSVSAPGSTPESANLNFTDGKQVAGSAASITVGGATVDLTGLSSYAGVSTASVTGQDGRAAGTLESFSIAKDGTLIGSFTNGAKQALARIAVATFTNPAGLEKAGNSGFTATVNSGNPVLGGPGDPGMGNAIAGSLEMSNVDLSQEFTNLIVAQRGFQANARIITTSDEVLQELTNLKR
ncbi:MULTISPECIES: flagellar hook protein FlgE [unclassified Arthrobacter]|uniref:flagellar hook protein FlgE n=1 Tax=unclassified Arthrobacter TaxID=235627 RepID=UPI001D14CA53|nr:MULTISPECIES: flagellar hook protein FlgE [unclassified Arthrobacter]MCC3276462.1 flagellar hook protein FlgE [Arthrobacter sp. zg-Y20]MCC3280281.1 flagellar hook protein FlgE [Arthrobacter sp. zg-Y40]MCC9178556.1 flagellar hook protein FlgE [Arthrobacter sp. zg-Y750]MDK1316622.1 flagellar hook protein FlgE [Arthrobacter sp. zg.Y20]MDK1328777.1 flagellar hook protein FlgE [Arthrobacter sp. zg-Y1143]